MVVIVYLMGGPNGRTRSDCTHRNRFGGMDDVSAVETSAPEQWFAVPAESVVGGLQSDADRGLSAAEAAARLARYGPNELTSEPPPAIWKIALEQLRVPMNRMLSAVVVVSFAIGEVSTGIIVALLVVLNLVLATRQEVKARES